MKTQPHCPQHMAQCSRGTQAEVVLASGHHGWGVRWLCAWRSPLWV